MVFSGKEVFSIKKKGKRENSIIGNKSKGYKKINTRTQHIIFHSLLGLAYTWGLVIIII